MRPVSFLLILTGLFLLQIQPAYSYCNPANAVNPECRGVVPSGIAPIFNNQQKESSPYTPPRELPKITLTPNKPKPFCNRPSDPMGPPTNCVPPIQISLADCSLQESILVCLVHRRTEITAQGTAKEAPIMPPQGLEIMPTGIENMLSPGILVLPNMCKKSDIDTNRHPWSRTLSDDWYCRTPAGQQIIIKPAS